MTLWMAAVIIVIAGIMLFIQLKNKNKIPKKWRILGIILLSITLVTFIGYLLLMLLLLDASRTKKPDGSLEKDKPNHETVVKPVFPEAKPANFDLSTTDVPEKYPDAIGLSKVHYEDKPVFKEIDELAKFILAQFYQNKFAMDFYLDREIVVDEGTGYNILNEACDLAMCYYPFSAYRTFDMYTIDNGDTKGVNARIKLDYTEPFWDLEARAEALEFVMKNPVPIGGFKDAKTEKIYARKIHDFVAKRVTYSPIGYDPEKMKDLETYAAFQEAYNVLDEKQTEAVCAGYARAFSLIANYAGINVAWMRGNETDTQSHAWNVLYPCDGSSPVLVDVTWDDTESEDVIGQTEVVDTYFYRPLAEEFDHVPVEAMDGFLNYINGY